MFSELVSKSDKVVGEFILAFAAIEEAIDSRLLACLEMQEGPTRQASAKFPKLFKDKLTTLSSIWVNNLELSPFDQDNLAQVEFFSDRLQVVAHWRNAICHSRLVRESNTQMEHELVFQKFVVGSKENGRRKIGTESKTLKPHQLRGAVDFLKAANVAMSRFFQNICFTFPNWPSERWSWRPDDRGFQYEPEMRQYFVFSAKADLLCEDHPDWPPKTVEGGR